MLMLDLFNAELFLVSKFIYLIIREQSADASFVQRSVVLVSKLISFIIRGKSARRACDSCF